MPCEDAEELALLTTTSQQIHGKGRLGRTDVPSQCVEYCKMSRPVSGLEKFIEERQRCDQMPTVDAGARSPPVSGNHGAVKEALRLPGVVTV